jgi:hypothetical protein
METVQKYQVLVSYDGPAEQIRKIAQEDPDLMQKIGRQAQEQGCELHTVTKGTEPYCGSYRLFEISVWNNAETARRFFTENRSIQNLLQRSGIRAFRVHTEEIEDNIVNAFADTDKLRETHLVAAGSSN